MELSPTAHVILGMLSWRPMSGYDIKSVVDKSTRFFWAASYGQIYPELRRLSDAGLIEADGAEGGRRRTEFRLTPAGRRRLRTWLAEAPTTFELRDEGLLKLFFASASPEAGIEALRAKGREHAKFVAELREIEAGGGPEGYAYQVLRYGIEFNEWAAAWCERTAAELARSQKEAA
jgi:DNA-binding PadR family transcriptional regulator